MQRNIQRLLQLASKVESIVKQALRFTLNKFDPLERDFNQVWPLIDSVEGFFVSPIQERWLLRAARLLPEGATIVEIGSFKGRSTCCLAYGCRNTSKHVFAIDTFLGDEADSRQGVYLDDFQRNIETCGLSAYVTPIPGRSTEVAKTWDKPIHFLFIDGSHEYQDVLADFENFFPYVVPGGIIAFHDVHPWVDGPVGFPDVLRIWQDIASLLLFERGMCSTIAFGRKFPLQIGPKIPNEDHYILLVDDEEIQLRLGQTKLKHLGYNSVAGYTHSFEALEAFRAAPECFDLVITDQTMPHMTGEALADEVRRLRPDIPIILYMDDRHTIDTEKAQALGIDVICPKPTGLHELGVAIRRVLARYSTLGLGVSAHR
jgi:CheY-like chemotaxis protein